MSKRPSTRPLVRLSERSYNTLKELSMRMTRPMTDVLGEAVERYRRERFLTEANRAYDALSPSAKRKYREELAAWDATLRDGLVDENWEEERRAQRRSKPASRRGVVGRP